MTNNTDVFDLDAAVADQADGVLPFRFRFGGEEFTCVSPNEFDIRTLGDVITSNDPAMQLAMLLGEDGWRRLEAVEAVFAAPHLKALVENWLKPHGLDSGKSGGSAGR
jgi:GGDEF domain-containing protein